MTDDLKQAAREMEPGDAEAFVRNYLLERDEACGFFHPDDAADPEAEREESAREIVARVLASTASPAGESVTVPVVKALEWSPDGKSRSPLGDLYEVAHLGGDVWQVRWNGTVFAGWYSSRGSARIAVQADYERRILSALTIPVPAEIERGPAEAVEAEAGPVGEAAAAVERYAAAIKRNAREIETMPVEVVRQHLREFYADARPADEPGEVERLTRERDDAVSRYASAVKDAAEQRALAERRRVTICEYMNDERLRNAEAALAAALESKARLVEAAFHEGRASCHSTDRHHGDRAWINSTVRAALSSETDAQGRAEGADAIARVRERDAGFNHGYLMAVANIINLHRETVVAADVLLQIDLTIEDAEAFELAEYDMEALERLRSEPRVADFFKRRAALSTQESSAALDGTEAGR